MTKGEKVGTKQLYIKSVLILSAVFLFSTPAFPVSNVFIDARCATATVQSDIFHRTEKGRFTIGVPPDKILLFGYPGAPWSSYTSISISAAPSSGIGNTLTIYGTGTAGWFSDSSPVDTFDSSGNAMNTSYWKISGLKITQNLTLVKNPVTNLNTDTVMIQYIIVNTNAKDVQVGLRILLDPQLGGNDNSPIVVQGAGQITQQQEWTGAAVPDAWLTFDNYINPTLKAQGTFVSPKPDVLIVGQYDYMAEDAARWTYPVVPTLITDTAVAMLWNQTTIAASSSNTFTAYFGIAAASGADLHIDKTVSPASMIHYGDTLSYNLTYSNLTNIPLTGLITWDTIPANTTLVDAQAGYAFDGTVISWSLPDINDTVTTYSRWFRVSANNAQGITVNNIAEAGYIDSYWDASAFRFSNQVSNPIATLTPSFSPTISPTYTMTQTHTISPTFTITPTFTATPPALVITVKGTFPNPAKVNANIVFNLTSDAAVKARFYTLSGEFVVQLDGSFVKGNNAITWNLKNRQGSDVSSGTYLYAIEAVSSRGEKQYYKGQLAVVK